MRLSIRRLAPLVLFCTEILALLALGFAAEYGNRFLQLIAALGFFSLFLHQRFSDRVLLWLLATTIMCTGFAAIQLGVSQVLPISAAVLHFFLFFSSGVLRNRYWRLALAFVEVVLAAIISPQAYMFIFIFLFIVFSTMALIILFLWQKYEQYKPEALDQILSPRLFYFICSLSVLIFLSALLIFPFLPRANWAGFSATNKAQTGYTELISYRESLNGWTRSNSKIVMQISVPAGLVSVREIFPLGLLRGRTLSNFDGTDWSAGSEPLQNRSGNINVGAQENYIEVQREKMLTGVLPLPYGAKEMRSERGLLQQNSGEWVLFSSRERAIQYRFLAGNRADYFLPEDLPRAVHKKIPMPDRFLRLTTLARQLNQGTRSDVERVNKIHSYLLRGFKAEKGEISSVANSSTHPVEEFLFDKKSGHCELFAGAAALLARSMGMPSRVVVGFHLDPQWSGSRILVRNSDAHAWAEIYTNESGWMPIDPTPYTAYSPTFMNKAYLLYDELNLYWETYILSYEWADIRELWLRYRNIFPLFIILLIGTWVLWRYFVFRHNLTARGKIAIIYKGLSMEQKMLMYEQYLRLRFGRREPDQNQIRDFQQKAITIARAP